MSVKALVIYFFTALQMAMSFAQEPVSLTKVQEHFVSPWIFTIDGDPRQLVLSIKAVTPKQEGGFNLDITYGEVNGKQGPFSAELAFEGGKARLVFVTQSKNRLDVLQTSDNSFQGTFMGKIAKLEKVAQETLTAKQSANTPAVCMAFAGGWRGGWQDFETQKSMRLWMSNIGPDCTAKISYRTSSSNEKPADSDFWQKKIDVRDGVATLSVPCSNVGPCDLKVVNTGKKIVIKGNYIANSYTNNLLLEQLD